MSRFLASLFFGLLAAFAAHAAGLPWWQDWKVGGDASDFGMSAFYGVWFLISALSTQREIVRREGEG